MRLISLIVMVSVLFLAACENKEAKPAADAETQKTTDQKVENEKEDGATSDDASADKTSADTAPTTSGGAPLESTIDKVSYAIGVSIGHNFKQQNLDLTLDLVMEGINDSLNDQVGLSNEDMQAIMTEFQKDQMEKMRKRTEKESVENLAAAKIFLEENKSKDGVKTTDSGLQYKVLASGTGDKRPAATSRVKVHYAGRLIDGTEFDSSIKRGEPSTFGCNQVIPGWTEALQLMLPGDKFELYIPPNLGYGPRSQGKIPANSLLIFEVELLEIL